MCGFEGRSEPFTNAGLSQAALCPGGPRCSSEGSSLPGENVASSRCLGGRDSRAVDQPGLRRSCREEATGSGLLLMAWPWRSSADMVWLSRAPLSWANRITPSAG